ncbi:hypothetical protein TU94_10830 [Streptomyces cyaneogriseus subsp. noncyanogenus]|uniref:Uncharacterized protein n=1 Tax=Streptomyces cyaneogriseus subsp. noncyanogenus TaxID=477245 RepID=A0A0C5G1A5_9ACTN|nr:hypothetical protein [Streptomyces cyaneogriseus]AJP01929.1 hypothetical protein TU94_10830 [Streptomyces cyaneogriseus subsp. noncyanogenus]
MSDTIRNDKDLHDRLADRITSQADEQESGARPHLRRSRAGLDRTRGRGTMAAAVEGGAERILQAIEKAEDQLHKHLHDVSRGVRVMGENHQRNDKALETMLNSIVNRSRAQDAVRDGGGIGKDRPDTTKEPHTVTLEWKPGMTRHGFERKAKALQRLGEEGQLFKFKGKTKDYRDPKITADYKGALENLIRRNHKDDPEFAEAAAQAARRMEPDHVNELQTGGPDAWRNLRMLDRTTNYEIGTRQIRPQIKDLPDGNPIRIDIKWWPDD